MIANVVSDGLQAECGLAGPSLAPYLAIGHGHAQWLCQTVLQL